jgi:5-methylcytosine-specific restriction enzyme subunit McrC
MRATEPHRPLINLHKHMRQLEIAESGPALIVSLNRPELDTVRALRLLDIAPTADPGLWELRAGRKVGVARAGDLQVTITPKIPIRRLIFLIGYSMSPSWSGDEVELDEEDDLLPAIAEAFSRLAQRALEQGLLHGYRSTEESLPVLRGRLRESEQLRGRFGWAIPLEVRFDDFTSDIPENQLLLAAAGTLLRAPGVGDLARQRLLRLRMQLADVTQLQRGAPRPHWMPSRLNGRYQPALRLAEIILAGDSFEHRMGDLTLTGFTFDMWRVYEDFVCRALREAFAVHGGRIALQDRWHLDDNEAILMKPDLVWYVGGTATAVADAKYKAEKPEGFPDADLYQLLAYCTALGLPVGHLIYAKGEGEPRRYRIPGANVEIHCHTLDLQQTPQELIGQLRRLAAEVARLAPTPAAERRW